jgi:hypothetical protein
MEGLRQRRERREVFSSRRSVKQRWDTGESCGRGTVSPARQRSGRPSSVTCRMACRPHAATLTPEASAASCTWWEESGESQRRDRMSRGRDRPVAGPALGVGAPLLHEIAQDRPTLPLEHLRQLPRLDMRLLVEAGLSSDTRAWLLRWESLCHRRCW